MEQFVKQSENEEKTARSIQGMTVLILNTAVLLGSVLLIVFSSIYLSKGYTYGIFKFLPVVVVISGILCLVCTVIYAGLKVLGPNEALALTFFGKYFGTLKGPGFFFVNPFATAVNPAVSQSSHSKKISLKAMTLNNEKQKINDQLGNPIIIGIIVIWKVTNTAKAVFNVDNYKEFLSIQCDSALRNIVRLYPYDSSDENNEKSLRGSSDEISRSLRNEIQEKVSIAGLEIVETRITHLSYAQEIAAVMLQRQQASAIVDARQMIVDGAVGMVEMALAKLNESEIVNLDEERKAAMVSNLLVVLCGNNDAQPIVNTGSLY